MNLLFNMDQAQDGILLTPTQHTHQKTCSGMMGTSCRPNHQLLNTLIIQCCLNCHVKPLPKSPSYLPEVLALKQQQELPSLPLELPDLPFSSAFCSHSILKFAQRFGHFQNFSSGA